MNRSFVTFLIFAIVCSTLAIAFGRAREGDDTSNPSFEVGRVVLESGEYLAPSRVAERRLPGIFKIDTATGKVWKYTTNIANKQTIEKWVPIAE